MERVGRVSPAERDTQRPAQRCRAPGKPGPWGGRSLSQPGQRALQAGPVAAGCGEGGSAARARASASPGATSPRVGRATPVLRDAAAGWEAPPTSAPGLRCVGLAHTQRPSRRARPLQDWGCPAATPAVWLELQLTEASCVLPGHHRGGGAPVGPTQARATRVTGPFTRTSAPGTTRSPPSRGLRGAGGRGARPSRRAEPTLAGT